MIEFQYLHPRGRDLVGYIPQFLNENDPRKAAEQFNTNYMHGGGWRPFNGFRMDENHNLHYPGDPVISPVAIAGFRTELIIVYPYAWVAIKQEDGTFEISRMD